MISFSDSTAWQEVESIVLSIISMLSGPNDESPSNVEAAKEWRDRKDEFKKKIRRCVRKSQEAGHQCLFSACGCQRGLKLCGGGGELVHQEMCPSHRSSRAHLFSSFVLSKNGRIV